MTNFEILKNAFFDSIIYLIIFSILSYAVFLILKKRQDKTDDVNIEIENKVNEEQFFGFEEFKNAEQFQKEANEIMKLVDDGKQVRVPFAKAMYILKNFKNYNVFTSEDQKIIFDKLKKIIDEEVELDHSKTIDKNIETERIQASTKPFDITNEKLEDGSIKVYNPNGYTIMKDSLIISSVNYADEIKKLEHEKKETSTPAIIKELEEKIKSFENILLNNHDEVKEIKKKRPVTKKSQEDTNDENLIDDNFTELDKVQKEKKTETKNETNKIIETKNENESLPVSDVKEASTQLNNEVESFFESFDSENINKDEKEPKIETSIEIIETISEDVNNEIEKTQLASSDIIIEPLNDFKRKDFTNLKNPFPLLEDSNLVFILQSFDVEHVDRVHLLVDWLLDYNNLADLENGYLFIDMDLDKNIFYVDIYLFLYLFLNFYADKKNLLKIFTISNQVVDVNAIKKLMTQMNYILANKYNCEFFKFVGKSESPFSERVISYNIDGKKIFSAQMIMINLEIDNEEFENKINEIKTHLIGRFRPQIHKAKFNNDKSEKVNTLGYEYFKEYFK